jgi:competence protein ComEC
LCEFSVSVLRAGFMAIFALLVKIRGKAYDNLSVLSLVATILLIINPLYIYNLSFILSFSSVLSIFLLSPPLTRLFEKVFKQKFASALALNCSVQFGLALTSAYYFGSINILSVICNLISVPIAICSFVILIFSCLIVLIFPFMSFLLQVYGWLIGLVVKFNFFISAHSPYIYFENFSIVYDLILKCLMFVISDYYFTCNQTKRVAMIVFVATCAQVVFLT